MSAGKSKYEETFMNDNEIKLDAMLKEFIQSAEQMESEKRGDKQRADFLEKFPISRIGSLSPEEYAIGHGDRDNFCWWIERGTSCFSYYFPGSSKSYGMFFEKKSNKYRFFAAAKHYQVVHPEATAAEILTKCILIPVQKLLETKGEDEEAAVAAANAIGQSCLLKLLILYYPDEFVHINSVRWLDEIIAAYGLPTSRSFIEKNRIVRRFYDSKKTLAPKGINNQDFIALIIGQLGLKASTRREEPDPVPYDSVDPVFWKMSHGSTSTGLSLAEREDCEKRCVITMHRYTSGVGSSKILSGDLFEYGLRKGDFVYLCYAGEVRRLVQITSDDFVQSSLRSGFVERQYRVVAEAKAGSYYPADGFRKSWTPNQNSTFVRIPAEDYLDFEKHITEPFFCMSVNMIIEHTRQMPVERRYWWMMSDPALWDLAKMPVGELVWYTTFNDKGNKRKEYSAFIACRPGDLVVGYVGHREQCVCAVLECTCAQKGGRVYFKKLADIQDSIKRDEIVGYKELADIKPMKTPQGSLFEITRQDFLDVMDLVLKKNPGFKIYERHYLDDRPEDVVGDVEEQTSSYGKEDFLREVYMSEAQYDELVGLLRNKKNIILQGAPGVGKTFAARRLAYSLIGSRDKSRTGFVQFHQSYSYENFIRGYKPTANGGFELRDGVFLEFCQRAEADLEHDYFFIIDEINRGNLSKIFGELLVLIEADKRGEYDYAVKLAYGDETHDQRFRVPKNLYIIGLMNTADRSLAMIDYALRRRFSFYTMKPALGNEMFRSGLTPELNRLVSAVEILNKTIENDPGLGKGFAIGHSYFCPREGEAPRNAREIVNYEIGPMLEEYWFEDPTKAKNETDKLLDAIG